ncbi:DUF559 domain-containing protein [Mycobacterium ostraviense]|uniref:DUF559 domain-containing protein n=1 Tax=Mycobacterium ostraviense TaxID=2738409 RepID=UPI001E5CE7AB|nr:DUF559 domain-containing protein [Mycobacterium ostraviense]UGT90744.1 DUF559 domain-containing protein [Mycobacterium ostraviense]
MAVDAGGEERAEKLERLKKACDSDLERHFLDLLEQQGYRLPDDAQRIVDGYYVRPDFAYHTGGMDVAVFIDGPVHNSEYQQQKDEHARAKLEDEAGWLVLRFKHTDADDGWLQAFAEQVDVFGPGKLHA